MVKEFHSGGQKPQINWHDPAAVRSYHRDRSRRLRKLGLMPMNIRGVKKVVVRQKRDIFEVAAQLAHAARLLLDDSALDNGPDTSPLMDALAVYRQFWEED